ncbi:MAG: hypothetical protein KA066_00140 [Candidatus Pacebacteria bacterium]|nr:hypothetical protein [Candidatus Paceibacterota bacterium]
MPFIAIGIAALLAIGGGASVAANSSVPGDALYGLKIGVNEKIEAALSFSEEAKAEEHLEAIAERHAEGKKLEAQGKLSAEAKADLNANIDAHAKAFTTALANVKASGNAEATAQLEAKLQAALDAAASANANVDANANANANVNSNSQGSDTGVMNSASTSGQSDVKVDGNGSVQVEL